MIRRTLFALLLVLGVVDLAAACSQQVPRASRGAACEYDEQCQEGLICRCVRRRNPDDEGPDEILAAGYCESTAFKCPASDAAVEIDTAVVDTGVADTGAAETSVDAPEESAADADDASADAGDGG